MTLKNSVQFMKGVGPRKTSYLKKLDIETIEDLIYFYPRSYEDRRKIEKVRDLLDGEKVVVEVIVKSLPMVIKPNEKMSITKVKAVDDTGEVEVTWFNQDYISRQLRLRDKIKVYGRVKKTGYITEISSIVHVRSGEETDKIGRILPVYNLTENLRNSEMIKLVGTALEDCKNELVDSLPKEILDKYKLLSLEDALLEIHFPRDKEMYLKARNRLVFEELFIIQIGLLLLKNKYRNSTDYIEYREVEDLKEFLNALPFSLTDAQKRVFKEISNDMRSKRQMNRLVQGDVGSGKTIIAVLSMYKAYKNGYQSVFMAPTEILASQHLESITHLFKDLGINCEMLSSSVTKKNKDRIINELKTGEIDVLIGTHALIEDYVEFKNLGLAITDEQHRFGVRQRARLSAKGSSPDILIMTATPIPRTLSLILHGDLDVSVIDELPPGRKKIKTYVRTEKDRTNIYDFVREEINSGRQVYIVCPLVEESEKLSLNSATELYEELGREEFSDKSIALLHGKMKPREKDEVMVKFKDGEVDILVSTTVIEVGVNVSNASIMIIENSERFGLAQLHQLRGRIGRGEYQSYCILMNEGKSSVSKERMKIMESTNDGFLISEKDLEIRGPGEFFGIRQHGLPELKIAKLPRDMKILSAVQETFIELLEKDPDLTKDKHKQLRKKVDELFGEDNLIALN